MFEDFGWDQPCYVISVAARLVGLPAQTLRYYERTGLLEPSRSRGNIRLYSPWDIERIKRIRLFITELGINLAGVEVALRLMNQIREMEQHLLRLHQELDNLKSQQMADWMNLDNKSQN